MTLDELEKDIVLKNSIFNSPFRTDNLRTQIMDSILESLGIESSDAIKIDIDPLRQRATISLFPSLDSRIQITGSTNKEDRIDLKFDLRF